ncbi:MAG: energy-coupling factor transporter ATPase, partial [Candidatus Latescibacterota bacterium]
MIEVAEVSFRYDGAKPVLRRISLEVHEGERIAILGPNGSGKTTFARCLNGLLIPTEGQVLVDGFSPLQHPYEVRRRVGMAFQNPDSQIVSAVVEREVAFGLENLGVPTSEMRHRVAEALERFGLSGRRLHPPHRLSGGEKGRLILASLWAMRPRYLVLDEPTSLLDPEGRREVREAIDELAREGVAVLWITQYPEEALWADRVLVFFGGELVADAPPGKVLDDPERLARWGLRAPFPILLNHRLRSLGLPLPPWTPTLR